jgi:hypothetical protein
MSDSIRIDFACAQASGEGEHVTYRITLAPLPGGTPPIVRLRRGLKTLLRRYRLRCKAVEELGAAPPPREEAS